MGRLKTLEEWLPRAKEVHRGRYDYSKVDYKNSKVKCTIICKEHGEFLQSFEKHVTRKQGCPICGREKLINVRTVNKLLSKYKNLIQPEEYKLIPLSNGKFTKVDNEDFEKLKDINWYFSKTGYADNRKLGKLHRYVMKVSDNMFIDHINGDKLDNRRSNLRICSVQENNCNVDSRKGSSSHFKGVSFNKLSSKFEAYITHKGFREHLGLYDNEQEAALAYNKRAIELHGEFARLNII